MDTVVSSEHFSDRLVYTVAEAGALLGISRAFAYELVARRRAPRHPPRPASSGAQGRLARPRRDEHVRRFVHHGSVSMRWTCISSVWRCWRVDVHRNVHRNVHIPAQGLLRRGKETAVATMSRAVEAGVAEALDVSSAGP